MGAVRVPAIITKARALAGLDSANVTDAQAIILVDDIYQELMDIKKQISEDFLHNQSFIDTTVYRSEYPLPIGYRDIDKILLVSALYTAPTYTAWAAGTAYLKGDKCTYGGRAYLCTADHTSTASFPYTTTFTTSAIMVAGETVTINGITYTAKAAGAAVNAGEFAIGLDEATCLANLAKVINSATAGTAATFISLSEYHKQLNTDIELTATAGTHTVVITSNISITCSTDSTVGAWGTETGGGRVPLYEGYQTATKMKIDYNAMEQFNDVSASNPIFFLVEDKIRLYPRPEDAVTRGIMIDFIQNLETLTATTDDAELYIEPKFEKTWLYGVACKMQEFCNIDSTLYMSKYELAKINTRSRWANRYLNKVTEQLPSLSNYSRNG